MNYMIDGIVLDEHASPKSIKALARMHHKLLSDAVFHNEVHLGEYSLSLRDHLRAYTRNLPFQEQAEFYQYYEGELKRMADKVKHHADDATGLSMFVVFLTLLLIATVLYFGVVARVVS